MDISFASINDTSSLKKLWKHCFNDDDSYINFWFDTVYSPKNTIIATESSEIVGSLQIVCYDIYESGRILRAAYICGVGVYKDYRNLGIGSKMMNLAHLYLKDNKFDFIFLISEADEFYHKLGYKPAFSKKSYSYKPQKFKNIKYSVYDAYEYTDDIKKIYSAYCLNFNNYILRNTDEFLYIINSYNGCVKLIYIDNKPSAYIVYDTENDVFHADEIAYASNDGMYAILDYIYKSGFKKAVINTVKNDNIKFFLNSEPIDIRTVFILPISYTEKITDGFISVL